MGERRELTVDATVENIGLVHGFVEKLLEGMDFSIVTQSQLDVAVEELFVNIAYYAYTPEVGKVTICGKVTETPPGVELTFIDEGTPYNPLEKEDPDTHQPLCEREIGGLGIFLAKSNVDDMNYSYRDGKNILTICKKLAQK